VRNRSAERPRVAAAGGRLASGHLPLIALTSRGITPGLALPSTMRLLHPMNERLRRDIAAATVQLGGSPPSHVASVSRGGSHGRHLYGKTGAPPFPRLAGVAGSHQVRCSGTVRSFAEMPWGGGIVPIRD